MFSSKKSSEKIFFMLLGLSCLMIIAPVLSMAEDLNPKLKKTRELKPAEIKRPLFSSLDHGDVQLSAAGIKLQYGSSNLTLHQGESGAINLPEVSDLIDAQGKVAVTLEFTLQNKTTKAFRFKTVVKYAGRVVASSDVQLLSQASRKVVLRLRLLPTNKAENLIIHGPVGTSDDTHIIFFNASLWTRVYAV